MKLFNREGRIVRRTEKMPAFIYTGFGLQKIGLTIFFVEALIFLLNLLNPNNYTYLVRPRTPAQQAQRCHSLGEAMNFGFEANLKEVSKFGSHLVRAACAQALAENPESPEVHYWLGISMAFSRHFEDCPEYLGKALTLAKAQNNHKIASLSQQALSVAQKKLVELKNSQ